MEEQRESDCGARLFQEQALETRPLAEAVAQDVRLGRPNLVDQVLVGRELTHQAQNGGRIRALGLANRRRCGY